MLMEIFHSNDASHLSLAVQLACCLPGQIYEVVIFHLHVSVYPRQGLKRLELVSTEKSKTKTTIDSSTI